MIPEYTSGCMCEQLLLKGMTHDNCMKNIFGASWIPQEIDCDICDYDRLWAILDRLQLEEGEIVESALQNK
jgi:hypothetical protein